jgi:hypothetical protein
MTVISELIAKPSTPQNPLAVSYNVKILEYHNFQLESIIRRQNPSQISYGSEFRSSLDLEELLKDHPFLPKL